jgi:hypothetical protein
MDLSKTKVDKITIKNPSSLAGMTILKEQVEAIVNGISFTDQRQQNELAKEIGENGGRSMLENYFGVVIVG